MYLENWGDWTNPWPSDEARTRQALIVARCVSEGGRIPRLPVPHRHPASAREALPDSDRVPSRQPSPPALEQFERLDHLGAVAAAKDQHHELGHDLPFVGGDERLTASHVGDLQELVELSCGPAGDGTDHALLLAMEIGGQPQAGGQVLAMWWRIAEQQNDFPCRGRKVFFWIDQRSPSCTDSGVSPPASA